jgi:hypothetical protein
MANVSSAALMAFDNGGGKREIGGTAWLLLSQVVTARDAGR